jgi:3-phenylpropionate/cinnamic acid dioxygenase small subunit
VIQNQRAQTESNFPQATMTTSRISQFMKDFLEPRSARMSTFNVSQPPPMGSILHCVTNQQIFCKDK